MAKKQKSNNGANLGFEAKLFLAADKNNVVNECEDRLGRVFSEIQEAVVEFQV